MKFTLQTATNPDVQFFNTERELREKLETFMSGNSAEQAMESMMNDPQRTFGTSTFTISQDIDRNFE